MSKLPPLNSLKAFEAAARHEGFIGASEELNVSRGAISRHIKVLEDHLDVRLCTRHAQGVRLTQAGRQFQPIITEAFAQIATGAARLTQNKADLRIICPPATSIRWLLPRIDDFQAAHPDIQLKLTTDFYRGGAFDPADADLGFSVSNWPTRARDLEILTLFPTRLTPVCTPEYLERMKLRRLEDLAICELLHETKNRADWTAWVDKFASKIVDLSSGQDFPNFDMAIKATLMGIGVAMGDLVLCREELDAGTLVTPFPDMICDSPLGGVCILGPRDTWTTPKVKAFTSWAYRSAAVDRAAVGLPDLSDLN